MSNLYELAASYRELADKLEDSELPQEVITDTLDAESGDLLDKVINVAKLIKNMKATVVARDTEIERMHIRNEAEEKKIEWLENYLLSCMEMANLPKVQSPWFVVSVKQNPPSTIIDDQAAIPADFLREIPAVPASYVPDKSLIKKAMNDGFIVPGAHLARTKTVSIK